MAYRAELHNPGDIVSLEVPKPHNWIMNVHYDDVDKVLARGAEGGKNYRVGDPAQTEAHSVRELKDLRMYGIYLAD